MIGLETTNNGNFIAETEAEESLMLMGKVNALKGIFDYNPAMINGELVNAIFNFGDIIPEQVKAYKEQAEMYQRWYHDALAEGTNLKIEIAELKDQLKTKEDNDGNTV